MDDLNVQEVAINLNLIKCLGFYQIFDLNGKILSYWNVYHLSSIVFIVIVQCVVMLGILGFVMEFERILDDIVDIMWLLNIFTQYVLSLWKLIIFMYKTDTFWKMIFNVTRLDFMMSKCCSQHRNIIYDCQERITKITNIYFVVFLVILIQWILYPLLINILTTNENVNQRFENILNFPFPITTHTYNQY